MRGAGVRTNSCGRRASKLTTLKRAIEYIRLLQYVLLVDATGASVANDNADPY